MFISLHNWIEIREQGYFILKLFFFPFWGLFHYLLLLLYMKYIIVSAISHYCQGLTAWQLELSLRWNLSSKISAQSHFFPPN